MANMGEEGIFCIDSSSYWAKDGIEDVFELKLAEDELALFKKSCAVIREYAHKAESL